MKIKIFQFTKKGIIEKFIERKFLKNLLSFDRIKNKTVWIKQELYEELVRKVKKKAAPKSFKKEKGITELFEKKYIRFRFPLWRYTFTDAEKVRNIFDKLSDKYNSVKLQGKKFPAQRIGLTIASKEKEFDEYVNSKTKRKNTREVYDFISTSTYANNEPSTEGMFEELYDKLLQYFYKTGKSPSLLDKEVTKSAKHFFVFFVEE